MFENPITLITATFFCISNHVYTLITFQHHIKQFLYIIDTRSTRDGKSRERKRDYDNFIRVPTLSKIKFFFLSFIFFFFHETGERLEGNTARFLRERPNDPSQQTNKQTNTKKATEKEEEERNWTLRHV